MDRLMVGFRKMSLRTAQRTRRRRFRQSPVEHEALRELEPDAPDPEIHEALNWARMYLDAQSKLMPGMRYRL